VGSEGSHLKLRLVDGASALDAIGFRMAETHGALVRSGEPLDVAARLEEDEWKGRRRLQAKLVDVRPAG
jgi:single-stranded-DNA-specific exonuclease